MKAEVGLVGYHGCPDLKKNSPHLTLEQIKISQQELNEANKETMIMKTFHTNQNAEAESSFDEQIKLRYMFSNFFD